MEKRRIFISIDIDESVITKWYSELSALGFCEFLAQPHITLAFIGDLNLRQIEALHQSLQQIRQPRFSLCLHGSGHFQVKNKQILWAGVVSQPQLLRFQQMIVEELIELGLPVTTSKFVPHISLIRSYKFTDEQLNKAHKQLAALKENIEVKSFGLSSSRLTDKGAVYQRLYEYNTIIRAN